MHQRFFTATVAREAVIVIANRLRSRRVSVMPLKGVLLMHLVYSDSAERALSDVDLLVPEESFATAAEVLLASGYAAQVQRRSHERTFVPSPGGLPIDLHRRLFPRRRSRLDTAGVFERAARNSALFGTEVFVPDPRDLLAHLIGHTANDHTDERSTQKYARDLELLVQHGAPQEGEIARHLDLMGLGRAARFALPVLATGPTQRYVDSVLAQLRPDPLGELLARRALKVVRSHRPRSRRGTLPSYLLAPSLMDAGVALADAGLERTCARLLGRPQLLVGG